MQKTIKQWEKIAAKMVGFDLILSKPDDRDYLLTTIVGDGTDPPPKASLKHYIPEIMDQGQTPLCADYAIRQAATAYYASLGLLPPGGFAIGWIYHHAKEIDGLSGEDGTTLKAICHVAYKYGFLPVELYPETDNWRTKPEFTREMYDAAATYKLKAYSKLNVGSLDEIERAIANGFFVLLGTLVTSINWADGWILQPEGYFRGGHASLGLEYDQLLKYKENGKTYRRFAGGANSWGPEWGMAGFYQMAEAYAEFKLDFGIPALMDAFALKFDQPLKPVIDQGPDQEPEGQKREFIIVHHTGAWEKNPQQVKDYHTKIRGWRDVGYNYLIDYVGRVYIGRLLNISGAHCPDDGMNRRSIGVALLGNFEEKKPIANQMNSLYALCAELCAEHEIQPDRILGHKEVPGAATVCPGRLMDLSAVRRVVKRVIVKDVV